MFTMISRKMSLNWSTLGHPAPDIKCYMSRRKIWVHGHFFSNDQWPVSVSPQGSTTMHYNQSLTHSHTIYSHYIILQHFQPVDTSLEAKMVEPRSTENCLNQIFSCTAEPLQCDNSLRLGIKEKSVTVQYCLHILEPRSCKIWNRPIKIL